MSDEAIIEEAASGGVWGKLAAIVMAIWAFLPDKHKERAIEAVVDAFAQVIGHFWDVVRGWAGIGVDPGKDMEVTP